MSELVVTLTGDEANLFRAQQKILDQLMKFGAGYDDMGKKGKKAADDTADAHVKAFQKQEDAARKLDQSYRDQAKSLELQNVAMTKGKAAAVEMKALHDGMSLTQAKRLGDLQRQNDIQADINKKTDAQSSSLDVVTQKATSWATAILSAGSGLSIANELIGSYLEKQEKSLELSIKLAKGQQDATVNLASIESPELKELFTKKLPDIQVKTGFTDSKALLDGLGASYGQVGDVEASLNAVEVAAQLTRQTPETLPTIAAGIAGLSTATGTKDAEENAALLLSTGDSSAVTSQAGLAKNLSPVLASATATVPTQDRKEASAQAAAMFAVISGEQKDFEGSTTKTQSSKFFRVMDDFYDGLATKTSELNSKINELKVRDEVTPLEKARIDLAEIDVQEKSKAAERLKGRGTPEEAKATIELSEAIARRDEMRVKSTLSVDERTQLAELEKTRTGLVQVQDAGTIKGRFEGIQNNDAAKDLVLKAYGNDEATGTIKALLDGNSEAAAKYRNATTNVTFDRKMFRDKSTELETLTPQLGVATSGAKVDAALDVAKQADAIGANRAQILNMEEKTMMETGVGFLPGVQNMARYGVSSLGGWNPITVGPRDAFSMMETDSQLAAGSIEALETRKAAVLENQAPGKLRNANINAIDVAIAEIKKLAASNVELRKQDADTEKKRLENPIKPAEVGGDAADKRKAVEMESIEFVPKSKAVATGTDQAITTPMIGESSTVSNPSRTNDAFTVPVMDLSATDNRTTITREATTPSINNDSNRQLEAIEKQNALVTEQNNLLKQVVGNTSKTPTPTNSTPASTPTPSTTTAIRNQANQPVVTGAN